VSRWLYVAAFGAGIVAALALGYLTVVLR